MRLVDVVTVVETPLNKQKKVLVYSPYLQANILLPKDKLQVRMSGRHCSFTEVKRNLIKSKYVTVVTVIDPDTKLPVEVEIRKLESGGMIGVDASWLDQDVGPVYSPYDKGDEIDIPDNEVFHEQS